MSLYKEQERTPEKIRAELNLPVVKTPIETTIQNLNRVKDVIAKIHSGEKSVKEFALLPFIYYDLQNTNAIIEDASSRANYNPEELKKIVGEMTLLSAQCMEAIEQDRKDITKLQKTYTALTLSPMVFMPGMAIIGGAMALKNKILGAFHKNKKDKELSELQVGTVASLTKIYDIKDKDVAKLDEFVKEADRSGVSAQFKIENLKVVLSKINDIGTAISSDIKRWEDSQDE